MPLKIEDAPASSVPLAVGVAVSCAIASQIVKIKDDFREMGDLTPLDSNGKLKATTVKSGNHLMEYHVKDF